MSNFRPAWTCGSQNQCFHISIQRESNPAYLLIQKLVVWAGLLKTPSAKKLFNFQLWYASSLRSMLFDYSTVLFRESRKIFEINGCISDCIWCKLKRSGSRSGVRRNFISARILWIPPIQLLIRFVIKLSSQALKPSQKNFHKILFYRYLEIFCWVAVSSR